MGIDDAGDDCRRCASHHSRRHHHRRDVCGTEGRVCALCDLLQQRFSPGGSLSDVGGRLVTTAISLTVGFITAYVIAQMPGRAKSIMIIAAVFPLLTGVVVRSFAWLIILGKNGILNAMLISTGIIGEPLSMLYTEGSVIVAMVYLFVPLMILTLVGVLEGIPRDLIDASASLGARPLMTFFQVILPLATPGLIVGAVWSSPAASPPMRHRNCSAEKSR